MDEDVPPSLTGTPASYAQYRRTPEGHYNLLDGVLFRMPSPTSDHQLVALNAAVLLRAFVKPRGLGAVRTAPLDVHLSQRDCYQPDVLYVSAARARAGRLGRHGLHGVAPELVVEVVSASTAGWDRGRKARLYLDHGTIEYWVVDPGWRTVEVRGPGVPAVAYGGDARFDSVALPGLTVRVGDLFEED